MDLKEFIRTIPDYPKPGILFRDITSLIADPKAFRHSIKLMADRYKDKNLQAVVGIESRGFIFGAALAYELELCFVPVRKKGKLPGPTYSQKYDLEYGSDELEIHKDALSGSEPVVLVDDLLATGGTALAAAALIKKTGAEVLEAAFVVDLPDIGGKDKLEAGGLPCFTMVEFEGH